MNELCFIFSTRIIKDTSEVITMDFSVFGDFIDEFCKWLAETGRKQRTIDEYLAAVLIFYTWFSCKYKMNFRPDQVMSKHIIEWQNEMLQLEKLSPSTVYKRMASLKSYWNFLVENNIVDHNPLLGVEVPKVQSHHPSHSWLTTEEEKKLLERVKSEKNSWKRHRNLCIVHLMIEAGFTVSEIVQLDWDQIFWEDGLIQIKNEHQLTRTVPMNELLTQSLTEWIPYVKKQEGPVILSQLNERMTRQGIHYLIKKFFQDIGLDQYSAHTLRHTFCRRLIEANLDLKEVSKLAGHASIETTKRYLNA
ncbi:tyrosine-type recombinase/integrase [Laceyella putida]|uniref:Tyrosine-type recombinase/integrase n=2 Tax=Laceyella putida TaxID=110101 RepID=A0ABW2RHF5_9BACL